MERWRPMSLPLRERGLKYFFVNRFTQFECVAPLAGAWIEMLVMCGCVRGCFVAPLAGAWIEIASACSTSCPIWSSLPLRERGLK